jgi:hypothetical protein
VFSGVVTTILKRVTHDFISLDSHTIPFLLLFFLLSFAFPQLESLPLEVLGCWSTWTDIL